MCAKSQEMPHGAALRCSMRNMLWLLLLIALIAIFGLGSVLEAAFLTLLLIAAVVVVVGLAIARVLGR